MQNLIVEDETKIIIFESTPNFVIKGELKEIEKLPDVIHCDYSGALVQLDISIDHITKDDIDNNIDDPVWRTRIFMMNIIKFIYSIDFEKRRQELERLMPYFININEAFHKSVSEFYIVGTYDDTNRILRSKLYENIPTDIEKKMEDESVVFFMIRLFVHE